MSTLRKKFRPVATTMFMNKGSRPFQEDYALIDREKGIFVVADGFGGPVPGAEVSKISCEAVKTFLFKEAGDLDATLPFELRQYFSLAGNVLFNSLIYSNRKVNAFNKGKNVHEKGGASVLAAFVDGELLAIANIGLCVAKLLRNGKLADLVIPRSFERMIDPFLTEPSERKEDWKVPLMAVGMSEDLEPEIFEYRLRKEDWLILSTDGLSDRVFPSLAALQSKQLTPNQAMSEFTKIMDQVHFQDNVATSLIIF